jgi:hypothetical protein
MHTSFYPLFERLSINIYIDVYAIVRQANIHVIEYIAKNYRI